MIYLCSHDLLWRNRTFALKKLLIYEKYTFALWKHAQIKIFGTVNYVGHFKTA